MKPSREFAVQRSVLISLFVVVSPILAQLPPSKGAPKVGQKAPDFTLPDLSGKPVRLLELLETPVDPGSKKRGASVLLVFYRGYW